MARIRKSDSLDVDAMAAHIREWWVRTEQWQRDMGAEWYPEALRWSSAIAADTGHTLDQVVAVVAAYSPRTRWVDNLVDVDNHLRGKRVRKGCLSANVRRAQKVLAAVDPLDALSGPKIRAFAQNILGNTSAVTIDIWAARAALDIDDTDEVGRILAWTGAYDRIADAYRKAAADIGIAPSTLQAAVWIAIRGKAD